MSNCKFPKNTITSVMPYYMLDGKFVLIFFKPGSHYCSSKEREFKQFDSVGTSMFSIEVKERNCNE